MNIFYSPKQRAIAKKRAKKQAIKAHKSARKARQKEEKIIASLEAISNISYQYDHPSFQNLYIHANCAKRAIAIAYLDASLRVSVSSIQEDHKERIWDNTEDSWTGGKIYFRVILKNIDVTKHRKWNKAIINTSVGLYKLDNRIYTSLLSLHRAMIKKA